jgi:hypothetical protein
VLALVAAVRTAEPPSQIVGEFTLTAGKGLTVRETSVEVTLHVPMLTTHA